MDRTEILKIVERFVSAIKANYDCDQVFLLVHMQRVLIMKTVILT